MLRKQAAESLQEESFRMRGLAAGRLENFSDAVFALAITLLLISTSPPTTFAQLTRFLYELLPFAVCMTLLIMIWYEHTTFFLRYGLRNTTTVFLNTLFLLIVLFYVYPLKFLTRLMEIPLAALFGNSELQREIMATISPQDIAQLMMIYGLGAASVFFILMIMYRYALAQAVALELTDIEVFDTRTKVRQNLLMGLVPLGSVVIAFLLRHHWVAGLVAGLFYFLYFPVMFTFGYRVAAVRQKQFGPHPPPQTENQPGDTQTSQP